MRVLTSLLVLLSAANVFAQVKIKVDPLRPVYKEPYEIRFTVEVEGDEEPQIRFVPVNVEILSKNQVGSQTQATFINGKAQITKSLTYVYEVVSNRFGSAYLKDIVVENNGKKLTHPTLRITILQQPQTTKRIFIRAEPDKESAYVGESILVRYFLYARDDVSVSSTDVKKFPKLNKFLKRFHQEQMIPERVRVDGRIYVRRVIYTAQVFAEKPGEYSLDPISLKIGYSDRGNRIGGFSFRMGRSKSTGAQSPVVNIDVKPLPPGQLPSNFTGLVGDLDFKIKINKEKFIINEPIEVELEVSGDGAFELFDPPSVLPYNEVEEFDKKADLVVRKDFTAIKKIEYTYLARSPLDLQDEKVEFSYFDPNVPEYKTVSLNLGNIKISGVGRKAVTNSGNPVVPQQNPAAIGSQSSQPKEFDPAPFFKPVNTILYNSYELSVAFGAVIVFFIIILFRKLGSQLKPAPQKALFKKAYQKGVDYRDFIKILSWVSGSSDYRNEIDSMDVDDSCKEYLKNLLDQLNRHYESGQAGRIKVKKKFLREIERLIEQKDEILYKL